MPGGPRYQYLPFTVSAETEAVTISYSYSGDDGSSVIDLGLFEPGPLTLGTASFRGYSGGAQRTITVGRNIRIARLSRPDRCPPAQWHVHARHVQGRAGRRGCEGHDRGGERRSRG